MSDTDNQSIAGGGSPNVKESRVEKETRLILTKEERKQAEFDRMQADKAADIRALSPDQARRRADKDLAELKAETDSNERYYKGGDIRFASDNNDAYKAAVAKAERDSEVKPAKAAANDQKVPAERAANDDRNLPTATIDASTQARLEQMRARDSERAAQEAGINGIEPAATRRAAVEAAQTAAGSKDDGRNAPPSAAKSAAQPVSGNQVESDEVFTATKPDDRTRLVPAEVEAKYVRVGDKFYSPRNASTVAFEDKGNRLETRSNSEQIAESMVTIARARGWDEIKVSGSETFRKEVWLEAAANGMQVKGYTPSDQDKAELLARERGRPANRVERDAEAGGTSRATASAGEARPRSDTTPGERADVERKAMATAFVNQPDPVAGTKDHPELAGAYAARAAMDRKVQADNLTPAQLAVVNRQLQQRLVNAIERGEIPAVQVREEIQVQRSQERQPEKEISR